MATRVTSPSDQKRTAVTLPESGEAAGAHTPAVRKTLAAQRARRIPELFLRGSENQPAILVDGLLQLRMLFFGGRRLGLHCRGSRSGLRRILRGFILLRGLVTLP